MLRRQQEARTALHDYPDFFLRFQVEGLNGSRRDIDSEFNAVAADGNGIYRVLLSQGDDASGEDVAGAET